MAMGEDSRNICYSLQVIVSHGLIMDSLIGQHRTRQHERLLRFKYQMKFNFKVLKSIFWDRSASLAYETTFSVLNASGQPIQTTYLTSWMDAGVNEMEPNSIKTFNDFQQANIDSISEVLAEKRLTGQDAIDYIDNLIKAFDYEIWERKEKSWSATLLKNEIKKSVESAKKAILPDYEPAKLSAASRRPTKIKTSVDEKTDKTVLLFMKSGLSESDAKELIKNSLAATFKNSAATKLPEVELKLKKCPNPKCGMTNLGSSQECIVCSSNLRVCDYCSLFTTSKDSNKCETHKDEK